MFTGLIGGTGELLARDVSGRDCRLSVRADFPLDDVLVGESIAVNGVCLSVESCSGNVFRVYASAETLACTTIGLLPSGCRVNLERALRIGDRLGGHLVCGHVDCLARVRHIRPVDRSVCIRLDFPPEFAAEVLRKGSVALDGVSLTVNDCGRDFLTVNVIPETRRTTTVALWREGDAVNMETDLIGKYVHRLLSLHQGPKPDDKPGLTLDFLREHGFL